MQSWDLALLDEVMNVTLWQLWHEGQQRGAMKCGATRITHKGARGIAPGNARTGGGEGLVLLAK